MEVLKMKNVKDFVNIKMMSNKIFLDTLKNAGGSFSINKQVAYFIEKIL